jgi:DNA-binding response OmpR family regulator
MTTDLSGLRVLIVEDEPLEAIDYQDILSDAGAEVIGPFASVGGIGVDAVESCDVAVIDYALRGGTSLDLQERLESLGKPFIVVTAYPRVLVRRHEGQTVVCKPISPELLCSMVRASARH